ncbi:hypothetical protein ACJX0J_025429, partial [Zea mays]
YGRILDIDLKIPPRPPGYAFVEFEDPHDADDAIYGRDGYNFDGYRLRICISCFHLMVELAHGDRGQSYSYDRSSSYSSACRGGVSRRSNFRVMVTGLPSSASWQDLKDHMRRAGDVCFSDVYREAGGYRRKLDRLKSNSQYRWSRNVFSWSANDLCGVNRDVIEHSLNVDPSFRKLQQNDSQGPSLSDRQKCMSKTKGPSIESFTKRASPKLAQSTVLYQSRSTSTRRYP